MVHRSIANSYHITTYAAEYCDPERGSRDRHELEASLVGENAVAMNQNTDAVGKINTPVTRQ